MSRKPQIRKHLGIFLGAQLIFEEHLKVITAKVNKTIVPLQKLQNVLPIPALMTIYKDFLRPNLDYTHAIYDEA